MEKLSPTASELLREAHRDGPSHTQRAHMWNGIEAGVAGSALGAGGIKAMSGLTKVLLGAVVGGAVALGVGAMLARPMLGGRSTMDGALTGGSSLATADDDNAGATTDGAGSWAIGTGSEARSGAASVITRDGEESTVPTAQIALGSVARGDDPDVETDLVTGDAKSVGNHGATHASAASQPTQHGTASTVGHDESANGTPTVGEDPIVREARLVAESRGALLRGDAAQALKIARIARATPNPTLEPEELALQARALHALGRDMEAASVEADLSRRFPDHALAH